AFGVLLGRLFLGLHRLGLARQRFARHRLLLQLYLDLLLDLFGRRLHRVPTPVCGESIPTLWRETRFPWPKGPAPYARRRPRIRSGVSPEPFKPRLTQKQRGNRPLFPPLHLVPAFSGHQSRLASQAADAAA